MKLALVGCLELELVQPNLGVRRLLCLSFRSKVDKVGVPYLWELRFMVHLRSMAQRLPSSKTPSPLFFRQAHSCKSCSYVLGEEKGLQIFPVEGQVVNILGFAGRYGPCSTIQL